MNQVEEKEEVLNGSRKEVVDSRTIKREFESQENKIIYEIVNSYLTQI